MARFYGSKEIAFTLGVSLRQLQCWDEKGIIPAAFQGHQRRYSLLDCALIATCKQLRDRGIPLKRISNALRKVRPELQEQLPAMTLGRSVVIVADANCSNVSVCESPGDAMVRVIEMSCSAFVFKLGPELKKLGPMAGGKRVEVA